MSHVLDDEKQRQIVALGRVGWTLRRIELIIDDLGMRKLPHTAAEDLLELIMRRYARAPASVERRSGSGHRTHRAPHASFGSMSAQTNAAQRLSKTRIGAQGVKPRFHFDR